MTTVMVGCRGLACWVVLGALVACESGGSGAVDAGGDAGAVDLPGAEVVGDAAGSCPSEGSGTLAVQFAGLPAGVAGRVSVSRSGVGAVITAPGTATLPAGVHSVAVTKATVADPIVRTVYGPGTTPTSICVRNGETTTLIVQYAIIASSNKLWNGNGGEALGFASASLRATAARAPEVKADFGGAKGITFDADGNLWGLGATTADAAIVRVPAAALGASGKITPDFTLNGQALNRGFPRAIGLTFDAVGNLWVTSSIGGRVMKFDAAELRPAGNPEPSRTLTGTMGPAWPAFDAAGNLWVTADEPGQVVRYAAAALTTDATAPDLVLALQTPPPVVSNLQGMAGLAFDKTGNLWVVSSTRLVRLTPDDLAGNGNKMVTVGLVIDLGVAALPETFAFDEGGGVWINSRADTFIHLPAAALVGGMAAPDVSITGESGPWFGFYPAPAGLPLRHALP